ncbi:MAG TPA: YciI family protein [Candidatus Latescibacteria bacterium]|nr:YciI family protein [Candidatus Latescibacterota bacterium]MDP7634500.1 YciI family protein [Candidatus Latescibacterota bacterium]HJN29305.1 YciI family protein [Candidatus Latescibacterota bacterium]
MKSLPDKGIHNGGEPLEAGGAVVSQDGPVTDGPFAETKEAIAGFVMLNAKSLEEAVALTQDCPIKLTGGSIEVRPVMDILRSDRLGFDSRALRSPAGLESIAGGGAESSHRVGRVARPGRRSQRHLSNSWS